MLNLYNLHTYLKDHLLRFDKCILKRKPNAVKMQKVTTTPGISHKPLLFSPSPPEATAALIGSHSNVTLWFLFASF
jgi:hypothetical protein